MHSRGFDHFHGAKVDLSLLPPLSNGIIYPPAHIRIYGYIIVEKHLLPNCTPSPTQIVAHSLRKSPLCELERKEKESREVDWVEEDREWPRWLDLLSTTKRTA